MASSVASSSTSSSGLVTGSGPVPQHSSSIPSSASGSSSDQSSWSRALSRLVHDLKARDESVQKLAAQELASLVEAHEREQNANAQAILWAELNRAVADLVKSPHTNDKLGGLWAIYTLIDLDGGEGQQTLGGPSALGQLVDYLQIGIASSEEHVVELAARAVGRLTAVSSTVSLSEVSTQHISQALDTFAVATQKAVPLPRRISAALVLSEISRQAPFAMHVHVAKLLEIIWVALSDENATVRDRLAHCLTALVSYVDDKAMRYDALLGMQIRFHAMSYMILLVGLEFFALYPFPIVVPMQNLNSRIMFIIQLVHVRLYALVRDHASENMPTSVLAVVALLYSLLERSKDFMRHQVRFGEATDLALRYGDHKDRSVRLAVLQLIPSLARCNPAMFVGNSLSQFMSQLLLLLQNRGLDPGRDREVLAAVGGVAKAVGAGFVPYLAQVMPEVASCLSSNNKISGRQPGTPSSSSSSTASGNERAVSDEALITLAALVEAAGERVYTAGGTLDAARLLDVVFEQGEQRLRGSLTQCCAALVQHAPTLRKEVQRRLLELLRRVLDSALISRSRSGGSEASHAHNAVPHLQRSITKKTVKIAKSVVGKSKSEKEREKDSDIGFSSSSGTSTMLSTAMTIERDPDVANDDLLIIALRTLGTFPFYSTVGNLDGVVRQFLMPFFDDQSPLVRSESAVTCAKLIIAAESTMSAILKAEALEKLLIVAIADPSPDIRVTVLAQMQHPSLDATLSEVEHLASLFIALNDEVQEVRELAMTAIGRLSTANPSYTMPLLRRSVIQLLSELEFSDDATMQAGATRLLTVLLRSARELVAPYAAPVLHALISRLRQHPLVHQHHLQHTHSSMAGTTDISSVLANSNLGGSGGSGAMGVAVQAQDVRVTLATLSCLGELAVVDADVVRPHIDELMPLILKFVTDHASKRRRLVGVQVLAQLARSTGYVIAPYRNHPTLLPLLLELVRTEKDRSIRREVIKVLGILGAIDPSYVRSGVSPILPEARSPTSSAAAPLAPNLRESKSGAVQTQQGVTTGSAPSSSVISVTGPQLYNSGDDYFPSVGIAALTRVLLDATLSAYHRTALRSVLEILKVHCAGEVSRVRPYLAVLMPALLHTLRTSERVGSRLLPHLAQLVALAKHEFEPYLESVFGLVRAYITAGSAALSASSSSSSSGVSSGVVSSMAIAGSISPVVVDVGGAAAEAAYFDVLLFIEEVARASPEALRVYLPELVPHVLRAIHGDFNESRRVTLSTLRTLVAIGKGLQEYLHVLAPTIVALFESIEQPHSVRFLALQVLGYLCRMLNLREYASRIIHPLARLLQHRASPETRELKESALKILCHFIFQLGADYAIFIPVIKRILARQQQLAVTSAASSLPNPNPTNSSSSVLAGGGGTTASPQSLESAALEYAALVTKLLKNQPIRESDLPRFSASLLEKGSVPSTVATSSSFGGLADSESVSVGLEESIGRSQVSAAPSAGGAWQLRVNEAALRKAWKTRKQSSKEDWLEWLRRLSLSLIRESPAPAFRLCTELAQVLMILREQDFPPLVKELFNAAFICLWQRLSPAAHADLGAQLTAAFQSGTTPPEVLQDLLSLAEYLEHAKTALPVALADLARLAETCHAYAKALHYREQELAVLQGAGKMVDAVETLEALLSLNNQLRQPHAAQGVLLLAQKHGVILQESWHEKLHRWHDALLHYERIEVARRDDEENADAPRLKLQFLRLQHESRVGQMRCLHALGEWPRLLDLAQTTWPAAEQDLRSAIAPLAAQAAWQMQLWHHAEQYSEAVSSDSVQGAFFRAVVALHQRRDSRALELVQVARNALDSELSALVSESYGRAYDAVVTLQQLAELEEIVSYRALAETTTRELALRARERLERTWNLRLNGMQRFAPTWQRVLAVRQLLDEGAANSSPSPRGALTLTDQQRAWLKYASLERDAGNFKKSHSTLVSLVGFDPMRAPLASLAENHPAPVAYAFAKQLWSTGVPSLALRQLVQLQQVLLARRKDRKRRSLPLSSELEALLVRVYLRLGSWFTQQRRSVVDALPAYSRALQHAQHVRGSREQRKAWAAYASVNFALVEHHETAGATGLVLKHAVISIHAHFQALAHAVGRASELRSVLRLLRLLFRFGMNKEVAAAFQQGFSTGSVDIWLQSIPQIIARLDAPAKPVRRLVHDLLVAVGREHPQALVYPLTVASSQQQQDTEAAESRAGDGGSRTNVNSGKKFAEKNRTFQKQNADSRTSAAQLIMEQMRRHSARLMDQTLLVSGELQRIAVSWIESWYGALEEAANAYFEGHDAHRMLALLQPLHESTLEVPAHSLTLQETAFVQAHARDLREARDWTRRFERERDAAHLQQAWALYYTVFKALSSQLRALKQVRLRYASPALEQARSLELAIPGTYEAHARVQCIARFEPRLPIITSKRRPRKLTVLADNGVAYSFLLKGHEDLRQDERVMQLFGLVNSLLSMTAVTSAAPDQGQPQSLAQTHLNAAVNAPLSIKRYSVIPLSPSTGLIGWVENCDTLNDLVTEYRTRVANPPIPLKFELERMRELAHNHYDSLRPLQKAELFLKALSVYDGKDLHAMMWMRAATSETWIEQRTAYTSTLAVMSMVGYVLGLGDRHPSNVMIERDSGRVIHIDFGDCFEVAIERDVAPERVPFRLTRMLVNAMEVAGIEGSFRAACEYVMRVLRDNRDSLMAVLEAFVHDPLINWRLVSSNVAVTPNRASTHQSLAATTPSGKPPEATFTLTSKLIHADFLESGGQPPPSPPRVQVSSHASLRGSSHRLPSLLNERTHGEGANERALAVIGRVDKKLTGRDFIGNSSTTSLTVEEQVRKLIAQAINAENLCQGYYEGWIPFY